MCTRPAVREQPTLPLRCLFPQALAPSMFVYVLAECVQTFLVTQGLVQPTTIAKAIVTVLGPLYYYGCMFWWVAVAPGHGSQACPIPAAACVSRTCLSVKALAVRFVSSNVFDIV